MRHEGEPNAPARSASEQLIDIRSEERPDAVVVIVAGAIDMLTAPRLRDALRSGFERLDGRALVLDLSSVEFLASAGLRVLVDAATEAVRHNGHPTLRVVVDHQRPVVRPIEITGLDNVLALYYTVAEALRA